MPRGVRRSSGPALTVQPTASLTALPWQIPVWQSSAPVLLLTGSAGGGKSRIAAERVHAYLKRYPGAVGLVLRKARDSLTNSTVAFLERVIIGQDTGVEHVSSARQFRYVNGSVLVYGGMFDERQRQQIRSVGAGGGVDIAWMEEATAFSEDDYNEVRARLRGRAGPFRQIILSTNPDGPTHWIYKRLILGGEAEVHYSSAADNDHNPPEYLDTLASLSGVVGERLARGRWVQAEGAVYDEWDDALHLVDEQTIPDDWRRIRAIDFGYSNPFVCQWWAMSNDDDMILYRELYATQTLVEDWARRIVELSAGEHIEATICDHDAEDRATLVRHGVPTVPADKGISTGLQRVKARLQSGRLRIMRTALVDGDPALDAAKRPTCTAQEIAGYVWPKTSDGKVVKEVPVKVNDHGCLVAGTVITTTRGAVPIEQVEVGCAVLTRQGYRNVLAAGLTDARATVWQVELSNGAILTGTGNHPVWTPSGWTRFDALRYGDIMMAEDTSCSPKSPQAKPRSSCSTACRSDVIQPRACGQIATTTPPTVFCDMLASEDCTKKFGEQHTGRYPMVWKSIIETGIRSITSLSIWNVLRLRSMTRSTARQYRQSANVNCESAWITRGSTLSNGTVVPQVQRGTPNTVVWPGNNAKPIPAPASSAEYFTRPNQSMVLNAFVPMRANQLGDVHPGRTMSFASANTAEPLSKQTSTASGAFALVHVVGITLLPEPVPVYNLTIADAPEYFANGVLVHNCDAMRYAVAYVDRGLPPPNQPGQDRFEPVIDRQPSAGIDIIGEPGRVRFGKLEPPMQHTRRRSLRWN